LLTKTIPFSSTTLPRGVAYPKFSEQLWYSVLRHRHPVMNIRTSSYQDHS